jgi:hypothetical protein
VTDPVNQPTKHHRIKPQKTTHVAKAVKVKKAKQQSVAGAS